MTSRNPKDLSQAAAKTSSAQKNILIVDDEESLLQTLSFTLRRSGFNVTTCANGRRALCLILDATAWEAPFDLIITDIQLPGISGLDLIDELRRVKIEIPVFVMTNYGSRNLTAELQLRNCRGYLDKPFTTEDFLNAVSEILSEKCELGHTCKTSYRQNSMKIGNDKEKPEPGDIFQA